MPAPEADRSLAVVITGPSRSGTSTVAAAVQALGVDFGSRLRAGDRHRNPNGYLEHQDLLDLGRRLRRLLIPAQGIGLMAPDVWDLPAVRRLEAEAVALLAASFSECRCWGFKNNGVLRFLPFWERVLAQLDVEVAWIVPVRHPLDAVKSRRKGRDERPFRSVPREPTLDYYEWLVSVVPYLSRLRGRRLLAVRYDRLLGDPEGQTRRIARLLQLWEPGSPDGDLKAFKGEFLDSSLRHFDASDRACESLGVPLAEQAWQRLDLLASDDRRLDPNACDDAFWQQWMPIEQQLEELAPLLSHIDTLEVARRRAELNPFSPLLNIYRSLRRTWTVRSV